METLRAEVAGKRTPARPDSGCRGRGVAAAVRLAEAMEMRKAAPGQPAAQQEGRPVGERRRQKRGSVGAWESGAKDWRNWTGAGVAGWELRASRKRAQRPFSEKGTQPDGGGTRYLPKFVQGLEMPRGTEHGRELAAVWATRGAERGAVL